MKKIITPIMLTLVLSTPVFAETDHGHDGKMQSQDMQSQGMQNQSMQENGMKNSGMQGGMMGHEKMQEMHQYMHKMQKHMKIMLEEKDTEKLDILMKEHMGMMQKSMNMMKMMMDHMNMMGAQKTLQENHHK